jgi:DNA-binding transcriptional ArsR family regulator
MTTVNWERAARSIMHPLAVEILEFYAALDPTERRSPRDLADYLQRPLPNVSYHVRALLESGLLRPAGKRQVRGAVQHFYVLA